MYVHTLSGSSCLAFSSLGKEKGGDEGIASGLVDANADGAFLSKSW